MVAKDDMHVMDPIHATIAAWDDVIKEGGSDLALLQGLAGE